METIGRGFQEALRLMVSFDPELMRIIALSFFVSGGALAIASAIGIPIGATTALKRFPLRGILVSAINAFMGLPPVVAGLFLYMFLSRSGPLGFMGLLYTPWAMIAAQTILALPIVAGLTHSAVSSVGSEIRLAARTLGATPLQEGVTIIREARYGIISAMAAALGRAMAEVGAVLMVGGNIAGYTRVMTTTIAMETDKGRFALAIALGIILLTLSLLINMALHALRGKGKADAHS